MKNNSLVKYQEGFFAKLKRKFKSIFTKQPELENNTEPIEEAKIIEPNPIQRIKVTSEKTKSSNVSKEDFFELYKKVVSKKIDIKSIDPNNLEKIYRMLEEELQIKKRILAQKVRVLEEKTEVLKKITNE